MGHDIQDRLTDYWAPMEQFYTLFYSNTIKRDRFLYIIRFLHFADKREEIDEDEKYDYGTESSVKLVSSAKSARRDCVWIKTVFWIITQSQTCNRRNINFPLGGENLWPNSKYEF
jgi:hypothetical protein